MSQKKKKRIARVSYLTVTMALEEMLAGPFTTKGIAELTGIGHRYVNRWVRVMYERKLIRVVAWERDALGRQAQIRVYEIGAGKDAKRPTKSRQDVNRDYRMKRAEAPLKGTPFYGLGLAANDSRRNAA